jgi:hypothetical protein
MVNKLLLVCLWILLTVQGKCKVNAESSSLVMLSRSLYSPLQFLVCDGKVTTIKTAFPNSSEFYRVFAVFSAQNALFTKKSQKFFVSLQ